MFCLRGARRRFLYDRNVGVAAMGVQVDRSCARIHAPQALSLKGMNNCTQAVITKMLRKRQGRVVNVASLSGLKGVPGQTNYSAAKGGMIAATKALAQEVAKRDITVNAVAPGFITSDMTKDLDSVALIKFVPANRFGEAQEVADLVSFLVSDKAAYITGEVININIIHNNHSPCFTNIELVGDKRIKKRILRISMRNHNDLRDKYDMLQTIINNK